MTRFREDYRDLGLSFGLRLSKLRRIGGLSQEDVAASLGVTRSYVSMLENDRRAPSARIAVLLAHTLGVNADDLLGEVLSRKAGREIMVSCPHWEAAKRARQRAGLGTGSAGVRDGG